MDKVEQQLAEEIAKCWDDPLRYVLFAFPWGEPGTDLEDYPDGPDQWQRDQLNAIRDHIRASKNGDVETALRDTTASGHGVGKSAETSWLILWFTSTRPHCNGRITAGTEAQLKNTTWRELSVWHKRAINRHWFKWTATRFYALESPETWGVSAVPWSENNSDAFAGMHADDVLVIYDEASAIADNIWTVTEGAMTTTGAMWFAFGNPTHNTGKFADTFGKMAHRWTHRQVDSRDCRMTNKAEIQQWKDDYGEDSDFFRIRVKGMFPRASARQLIPSDVAETARRRIIPRAVYGRHPILIGVDVARYGDDRSTICKRQGPKLWHPDMYREKSTMEVASLAYEKYMAEDADAVCVDGNGIGAGVVDRLEELGIPVVDVQSAEAAEDPRRYFNARSELWGRMADWVETADLPDCPDLIEEMCSVEYGYNAKLQLQLETSTELKRRLGFSPDVASCLAMTQTDTDKIARAMRHDHKPEARPVKKTRAMGAWT